MSKKSSHLRRLSALAAVTGAAIASAAGVAAAATTATTTTTTSTTCSNPALSQPFTAWGDTNSYFLHPGQTTTDFTGTGWTLSGGARILSTTRADGKTGYILDLPSGSKAVSPTVCVTNAYPRARAMVRNVKGSEGVFFSVSYAGTSTWTSPKNTGQFHGSGTGWTAGDPVNLQPANVSGWQTVKFTFVPGGTTSDFQVYNFYVDPRMF